VALLPLTGVAGARTALGINDRGQILGTQNDRAVFWHDRWSIPQESPALDGNRRVVIPFAINNRGIVAGLIESLHPFLSNRAVVWQRGVPFELSALPTHNTAGAFAINNRGTVVGTSGNVNDRFSSRGVLWERVLQDHDQCPDSATGARRCGNFDSFVFQSTDFGFASDAFVQVVDSLEILESEPFEPLATGAFREIEISPE
jgi:hypothetical protein